MTREIKKQKEAEWASQLAKLLKEEWSISAAPDELLWPDILVQKGSIRFGLEVRELIKDMEQKNGSVLRRNENERLKRLSKISKMYYSKSNIPLKVSIIGRIPNDEITLDFLIDAAAGIPEWGRKRFTIEPGTTIYICRYPEIAGQFCKWEYVDDRVGWRSKIDCQFIQKYIDEKPKKLDRYRNSLSDVRLLLVADAKFSSGMVSFDNSGYRDLKGFNEVYLLISPDEAFKLSVAD